MVRRFIRVCRSRACGSATAGLPPGRSALTSRDRRSEAPRGTRRHRHCTQRASPAPMSPRAMSRRRRFPRPQPGRPPAGAEERVGPDHHLSSRSCRIISITSGLMDSNDKDDRAEFPRSIPEANLRHTPRPRVTPVEVDLAALSHPGWARTKNEDHYLVLSVGRHLRTWMTNLPEGCVPREFEETAYGMAVADGMGGRAAGEVASQLALSLLIELVLDTPDWIFSLDEPRLAEVLERFAWRFRTVN